MEICVFPRLVTTPDIDFAMAFNTVATIQSKKNEKRKDHVGERERKEGGGENKKQDEKKSRNGGKK